MQTRIDVLHMMYKHDEVAPFTANVARWIADGRVDALLSHTFRFDFALIAEHSDDVAVLVIADFRQFRRFVQDVARRIMVGMAGRPVYHRCMRIKVSIRGLPVFDQAVVFRRLGSLSAVRGIVSAIADPQECAVRYVFRCENAACRREVILRACDLREVVRCGCGEVMREEQSRRLTVPCARLAIETGSFAWPPVEVIVKGAVEMEAPPSLGHEVEAIGLESVKSGALRLNAELVRAARPARDEFAPIGASFGSVLAGLAAAFGERGCLLRTLLAASLAAVINGTVLFVTKSQSDARFLWDLLHELLEAEALLPSTLFRFKRQASPLLGVRRLGVVPEVASLNAGGRTELQHIIASHEVRGRPLACGLAVITWSGASSAFDAAPFDMAVRVPKVRREALAEAVFGGFDAQRARSWRARLGAVAPALDGEVAALVEEIAAARDVDEAVLARCARGMAALRGQLVAAIDVQLGVYFLEERRACATGEETTLSQLPRADEAFFGGDLSALAVGGQAELFDCWRHLLGDELARFR